MPDDNENRKSDDNETGSQMTTKTGSRSFLGQMKIPLFNTAKEYLVFVCGNTTYWAASQS